MRGDDEKDKQKTKEKEEENEGTYKNMETCGIPSAGQVAKLRPVG
jgi:hypothetical protein